MQWIYLFTIYKLLQFSPLGATNLLAKEFKKRGKISDSCVHHFWASFELIHFAEPSKAHWRKVLLLLVIMRGFFGQKFDFRERSLLILKCRLYYRPLLFSWKVLNRENKASKKCPILSRPVGQVSNRHNHIGRKKKAFLPMDHNLETIIVHKLKKICSFCSSLAELEFEVTQKGEESFGWFLIFCLSSVPSFMSVIFLEGKHALNKRHNIELKIRNKKSK